MLLRFTLADRNAKPLEDGEMSELLNQPNILRLAMVDIRDGMPLVHPVWYYYEDGKFFASVDRDGVKAHSLRKNPNVYFLVDIDPDDAPPRGARGKGIAKVIDDPEYATRVTTHNVLRYLGSVDGAVSEKLIEMGKDSSVVEITPRYMATWKF
ncbi:MAG: pyridoxamine 5'-phosphate oxidase family protein [Thaumarchaeota archaeon]|nr:MAG: pyridoxamine 5'-phosphate oxidase family protein [Nitrososphaerota archaeon]TLY12012.1 MAG: pyridoxamine 5'-phosphate oxidase family protein [Nitrososphaerota archaeon]